VARAMPQQNTRSAERSREAFGDIVLSSASTQRSNARCERRHPCQRQLCFGSFADIGRLSGSGHPYVLRTLGIARKRTLIALDKSATIASSSSYVRQAFRSA